MSMPRLAAAAQPRDIDGLSGLVLDVVGGLGAVGVALLSLVEMVFPPIPSEVVLPLAGFQANVGQLSLLGVLVAATAGSVAGSLLLYWLGAAFGQRRATALLSRLPLLDAEDVEQASDWFHRHGGAAVFTGRFVPGVRSLVSLPAGAQRMPLLRFTALTLAGTLLWNTALVLAGYALGTQYELVDRYSAVLDYIVLAAIALGLGLLVHRRLRKRRATTKL